MPIRRLLRSTDPLTLERISLFSDCGSRQLQKLERIGTRVHVKAGRKLVTAGDFSSEILLVLSGTASCFVDTREVATFTTGDFFGEVATLCGGPRTATVTATSDMDLWVLVRREFDEVLQMSPHIARRMLRAMAQRLRAADVAA
jgi:CRP/FNR family transcriptional regulator, cyclic AMP receptor protein